MVRVLAGVKGIGVETADMLVHEIFFRPLRDRRAVARYAGLTGSPAEGKENGIAIALTHWLASPWHRRSGAIGPSSGFRLWARARVDGSGLGNGRSFPGIYGPPSLAHIHFAALS